MAIIHEAELVPSKSELLAAWLPGQPWLDGADASALEVLGTYRFDDPDGEVGVETFLLGTADGRVLQVPLSYRGGPLDGADGALVGTLEHSVLGRRWAYDAGADPVYARTLAAAIMTGGTEAELEYHSKAGVVHRRATVPVRGSGAPGSDVPTIGSAEFATAGTTTLIHAGNLTLALRRLLDRPLDPSFLIDGAQTLAGSWPGQDDEVLLAAARLD